MAFSMQASPSRVSFYMRINKLKMKAIFWLIFSGVTFLAAFSAFAVHPPEIQKALTNGRLMCHNIFHANAALLIPMMDYYRGEETGAVVDPLLTHSWAVKGHLSKSAIKDKWKVEYFDENVRAQYEVHFKDGKFYDPQGKLYESAYDPVDLFYEESLFVIDKDFRFFILPMQERGRYHHSSLSAGDDIAFAGTISIAMGMIREISANSGHYKPSAQHALKVLAEMKRRGIDLTNVKLHGQAAYELSHSHSLTAKEIEELLQKLSSAAH